MLSSEASQRILYASAGISAFAVHKHTALAFGELFPKLDHGTGIDHIAISSAKSNFLQVGGAWAIVKLVNTSSHLGIWMRRDFQAHLAV